MINMKRKTANCPRMEQEEINRRRWLSYLSIPWWKRWLYNSPEQEDFFNYLRNKYQ